jgi:hypothetical protein
MRAAQAIIGLICIAIGLRWLQAFIFTDYRAHLRPVIIPFGVVAIPFGLFMLILSMRGSLRVGRGSKR